MGDRGAPARPDAPGLPPCAGSFAERSGRLAGLLGLPGTGKTHLAAAIANERRAHGGQTAYFITAPDLLDYLRSAYAPDSKVSYDKVFEAVRTAPLLVLDDLGAHSGHALGPGEAVSTAELPLQRRAADRHHQQPGAEGSGSAHRVADAGSRLCDVWALDVPPYRLELAARR